MHGALKEYEYEYSANEPHDPEILGENGLYRYVATITS